MKKIKFKKVVEWKKNPNYEMIFGCFILLIMGFAGMMHFDVSEISTFGRAIACLNCLFLFSIGVYSLLFKEYFGKGREVSWIKK